MKKERFFVREASGYGGITHVVAYINMPHMIVGACESLEEAQKHKEWCEEHHS